MLSRPSFPIYSLLWMLLISRSLRTNLLLLKVHRRRLCKVSVPSCTDFRKAVKAEYSNRLSSVDAGELIVYKYTSAFVEGMEDPSKKTLSLMALGNQRKTPS
jgi:hypothetical protein